VVCAGPAAAWAMREASESVRDPNRPDDSESVISLNLVARAPGQDAVRCLGNNCAMRIGDDSIGYTPASGAQGNRAVRLMRALHMDTQRWPCQ
jgi:hypothetical protein